MGGRQTAIVVVCTYYGPHTYVPGISRLPRYVYDTRYVLCTRYVCTWYQPATHQIRMYLVPGISRQTNVPPVDAHVWRQLHVSAVARCSDSYCILVALFLVCIHNSRLWRKPKYFVDGRGWIYEMSYRYNDIKLGRYPFRQQVGDSSTFHFIITEVEQLTSQVSRLPVVATVREKIY